ncbi:hypothetical protein L249_1394 [Ophiocordyceps polyrhachis-furcata BCC 54312]|uniref:Uncharacterized protein n=1 Tax=Ophiocordyceps polyrhachis-furcata BCC 54312 TaxID=1330021 RepID=A0A367L466_9HYPO|nr:hypothetical protein L249_1394 [Ophiocordyceps polyrhachis-furcata BCC 54312]
MRFPVLAFFVYGVIALPATTTSSCARDGLFTSLSRHGRSFCSTLVQSPCHQVTTPTEYAGLEPSVVSSRCGCVLAETCLVPSGSSSDGTVSVSVSETGTSVFKLSFNYVFFWLHLPLCRSGLDFRIIVIIVLNQAVFFELGFTRTIVRLQLAFVAFIHNDDPRIFLLSLLLFLLLFLLLLLLILLLCLFALYQSIHEPQLLLLLLLLLKLALYNNAKLKPHRIVVYFKPYLDSQSRPHRHIGPPSSTSEPNCYHLPMPTDGRRALPHNDEVRAHNASLPFPFIEAVDFAPDGVKPLFLTLRDAARGTHYLDLSDRGHVAIVDSLGNAMMLDAGGIHFSTNSCRFDVSFHVGGLYQQLQNLSGQVCARGGRLLVDAADETDDDDADAPFGQTLFLRDQCGHPVGRHLHQYPLLRLGSTECRDVDVDEARGRWRFDCAFPGQASNASRCRRAVRRSVANFLFVAPFADACPDLSTVITTLEATSQDFLNPASLREELYSRGLDAAQRADADLAVIYYEQLWEILKQALSRSRAQPPAVDAAIKQYLDAYSAARRRFDADLCRDLHAPDPPLDLTLRAGAAPLPVVARFASAPPPDAPPPPRNLTVLDPSQRACCPHGSDSSFGSPGTCSYPATAILGDSGCVCGRTADGGSIAFEYTGCDNFVARCSSDADCASAGHSRHVCLTGSCCGGGVCVDPYECSRNDTGLIPSRAF